jgi:NADPH2:quinone reductase
MEAAWFEEFGGAEQVMQVGEQPKPLAEPGQVLVKLAASGVNPSDVKKRAGASPNLLDEGLVIPHSDGAGIIESVGSGVSEDRLGCIKHSMVEDLALQLSMLQSRQTGL